MKPLVVGLVALGLALTLGLNAPARPAQAEPAGAVVPEHVLPAAPSKTTKPKPKPKPKPSVAPTPSASPTATPRRRTAADEEGERWVQLALVVGGGLLGAVALFFGIGALLRRRPRPRS